MMRRTRQERSKEGLQSRLAPEQKKERVLSLNEQASEVFANALLNPPEPSRRLTAAAKRYQKRVTA